MITKKAFAKKFCGRDFDNEELSFEISQLLIVILIICKWQFFVNVGCIS